MALIFLPIFVFGFCLAIGVQTLCPTIYWRDAPEFVDVVFTLGIPHPAGSPTYVLLNHIFSYLPYGNIAWRVNFASTFWFAACLSVFSLVIHEAVQLLRKPLSPDLTLAASWIIPVSFAVSPAMWMASSFAEVYTMNAFFVVALLWFALKFISSKDLRYLFAGAFSYGLMAGVHATAVFFLPAVLFLFFSFSEKNRWVFNLSMVSFFFLLGFSVYLFLPIRSLANPTYDWGNPETLSQLVNHMTDRKTQSDHFDFKPKQALTVLIPKYVGHLMTEMGWANLLFCFVGLYTFLKQRRSLSLFLLLFISLHLAFFLTWKTGDGFIPTNLVWLVFSGAGLTVILQALKNYSRKKQHQESKYFDVRWEKIAILVLVLAIFSSIFPNPINGSSGSFAKANKSNFYNAYETAKGEYQKLRSGSIAIVTLFWFPFRYFQDVEGFRADINIIMASDVIAPKYFNVITQERYPNLVLPTVDPLTTPWFDYMPQLINLNIAQRAIFYEPHLILVRPIFKNLRPDNFLFEVVPNEPRVGFKSEELENYLTGLRNLIGQEMHSGSFDHDLNSKEYFMTFLLFISDFLILHKHDAAAQSLLRVANHLRPNQGSVEFYLAQTDLATQDEPKALVSLNRLLSQGQAASEVEVVLGKHYLSHGDLIKSGSLLKSSYARDPEDFLKILPLIEWHWRKGEIDMARNVLRKSEHLNVSPQEKEEIAFWKNILNEIDPQ